MTARFDELSIREVPGSAPRRARSHGFAINGQPLGEIVGVGDRICVLSFGKPEAQRRAAKQLRLAAKSELASGRVPIYVCAECGDLGCGALAVRVTKLDDSFVWSELSHETPWGDCSPVDWLVPWERDFYFALDHYLGVIY